MSRPRKRQPGIDRPTAKPSFSGDVGVAASTPTPQTSEGTRVFEEPRQPVELEAAHIAKAAAEERPQRTSQRTTLWDRIGRQVNMSRACAGVTTPAFPPGPTIPALLAQLRTSRSTWRETGSPAQPHSRGIGRWRWFWPVDRGPIDTAKSRVLWAYKQASGRDDSGRQSLTLKSHHR
jgi:hypothetical protein